MCASLCTNCGFFVGRPVEKCPKCGSDKIIPSKSESAIEEAARLLSKIMGYPPAGPKYNEIIDFLKMVMP